MSVRGTLVSRLALGLAVGLGTGAGLALVLVIAGVLGTGEATATHDDSSVYHACVSKYTGATRIMRPGQPPNCSSAEFEVDLGAGDPAENLTYTVRTTTSDISDLQRGKPKTS